MQINNYLYQTKQFLYFIKNTRFAGWRFLIFLFALLSPFQKGLLGQTIRYEEIPVNVRIQGVGAMNMEPLYNSNTKKIFLPMAEVLMFLHIKVEASANLDSLSGFIVNEDEKYLIDNTKKQILVHGKSYQLKDTELIKTEFGLYLDHQLLGEIFGLHCEFNFRNLMLEIKPDFEVPAIREIRLAQFRKNMNHLKGDEIADTTINSKHHISRFGMLDWAINSIQSNSQSSDTRVWLALGAELFGGETNFRLNYSSNSGFNSRSQEYYWRWVNNQSKAAKQIRLGKISTLGIASVYDPMVGISITNASTTYRRSFGEYTISDYTEPGWTVELYVNNVIVDYQTADASGFYSFDVPLVYGASDVMLKFYGPYGEERTEKKTISVPFNFLPSGEIEYTLTSGVVMDVKHSNFARAEIKYGVNRFLTLGGGLEYLSSITSGSKISFVSAFIAPFQNFLVAGEYAHGVRTKILASYRLASGSMFELNYRRYTENQKAIKLNYLEERSAELSVPFNFSSFNGYTRWSLKQNVYKNLTFNTGNVTLSSFFGKINTNISTYTNWIRGGNPYIYSNVGLGVRFSRGLTGRVQGQWDIAQKSITSVKAGIEKKILHSGYLSISAERNIGFSYRSIEAAFRWNFAFSQVNSNWRIANNEYLSTQGARGSLAFGSGNGFIHADTRYATGRSGIAVVAFIDINHNGEKDDGEPFAKGVAVKMSGGRIVSHNKDSIIRITGLEPYTSYLITLDDKELEQISWQLKKKKIRVYTDPNQFKKIYIPVLPMGEVNGWVFFNDGKKTKGQGRIIVNFYRTNGKFVASTLSEKDGGFTFLGLPPGDYYAKVDSTQLKRLNMRSVPSGTNFSIKTTTNGSIVYNIQFEIEPNVENIK